MIDALVPVEDEIAQIDRNAILRQADEQHQAIAAPTVRL